MADMAVFDASFLLLVRPIDHRRISNTKRSCGNSGGFCDFWRKMVEIERN